MITGKRLAAELEAARADVAALERAQALLNGSGRQVKLKRLGGVLGQAMAIDAGRRGKRNGPAMAPGGYSALARANRERTARALAMIAERGPMTSPAIVEAAGVKPGWISPMVSRGYLVGKKDGTYKRTKKEFSVTG